jgi:hypothetical protein
MKIRWLMIGADVDPVDATHLPAKVAHLMATGLGVQHSLLLLTVR